MNFFGYCNMTSDIIIIGAGASGLMAGIAAARGGATVTIIEKMPRPARKIMITGKGRCNFTNVKAWNEFSQHIRSKSNFLRPAFYNLSPEKMIVFLEENGLETVVERGDRAFPASHRASDVIDTLVNAAKAAGVRFETGCGIESVEHDGECFVLTGYCHKYSCKKLVIATGGLSYPGTGSTGDGYKWAAAFGHKILPCFPSLTALVPKGYKTEAVNPEIKGHIDRSTPLSELGKALCGTKLKNVGLSLYINDNEVQNEFGDLDFTDGGIEGPIGFQISRNCVKAIFNGSKARIVIDLKPGVELEDVQKRVRSVWNDVQKDPRSRNLSVKGALKVILGKLMPQEMILGFMMSNPGILNGKKGNERIDMNVLAESLKEWAMPVEGFVGYERSVVTAGGVSTDEVFPKTMESRLSPGLYLCGELLDVDCDTGGYNLQCAFSTGYLAGESAASSLHSCN